MRNLFTNARRSLRWASRAAVVAAVTLTLLLGSDLLAPQSAAAYPFWAQENYEMPREATGKIVCANCHLAKKPIEVEFPQAVLPDSVFKGVVKVPYEDGLQQIQADGSKGGLNVGAVVMLPEGFKIAPQDRMSDELKEETEGLFYQSYAEDKENIVIVGPLGGEESREIVFPIISPDPRTDKSAHYGKYAVHVGGNRGRGQVYPTGDASNNNAVKSTVAGVVSDVSDTAVTIDSESGAVSVEIPAGLETTVSAGDEVAAGDELTANPNVGGFGQHDVEVVLQSSSRILGMLVFFAGVMLTQIMLVLKKKQVEKVQAAEMNF